jgi:TRAP transporter TAXI family solute receptor
MKAPRKSTLLTSAALLSALALTACGGGQRDNTAGSDADASSCDSGSGQISIATGNSTGVYYVVGGGLAKIIGDKTDLKATAAETGASVQNIEQLVAGDYDIAFSLADTAADAVEGKNSFTSKQKVSALGRIYSNYTQVVVRKDSGIKSIADFKGKRISTGSPKSGTEVIAERLIDAAGLKKGDVSQQRLDLTKTIDGMKDGSIDGLVWSGGLPTPALTDLFTSSRGKVEFIDAMSLLPDLKKISPVYEEATIPAATYKTDADVKVIAVPNVLLVSDDMPDNQACALAKVTFDSKEELSTVHPSGAEIDPANALDSGPIPIHPGAKRAIDELVK